MTAIHGGERLLLRVPEAASVLGVGRSTVYELINAGELRAVHIGRSIRIPTSALLAWVERQTETGIQEGK
jgi:excisionase family DNA binding protein